MSEIIVDEQWATTRDHSARNRIERRDGHTVRTIADIDHHYHFQSSVTSHLLTPDGWTFIHSVPTHRMQGLRPDRDPSTAEGLFMSCHETTFTILAGVSDAVTKDACVYCHASPIDGSRPCPGTGDGKHHRTRVRSGR